MKRNAGENNGSEKITDQNYLAARTNRSAPFSSRDMASLFLGD
jgi:hypothetical protein